MALVQEKKGGPYTKNEQRKRREEVYRLYFDYGYSARKIAEFLKVNRGTISKDIDYCFANIIKKSNYMDPKIFVMNEIERLEIQRTRQRKQLDKAESFMERDRIEKFIFNITIQIANIQIKLVQARKNVHSDATEVINKWYEEAKIKMKVIPSNLLLEVSNEAHEKMYKIYKDENKFN